jgi:hypothetical protein
LVVAIVVADMATAVVRVDLVADITDVLVAAVAAAADNAVINPIYIIKNPAIL